MKTMRAIAAEALTYLFAIARDALPLVVAIVAIIAIKFGVGQFSDKGQLAMENSLKNVSKNSELSFRDNGTYEKYVPPTGMGDVTISFRGMKDGWYASATHSGSKKTCLMAHGSGAIAGMLADEPVCSNK